MGSADDMEVDESDSEDELLKAPEDVPIQVNTIVFISYKSDTTYDSKIKFPVEPALVTAIHGETLTIRSFVPLFAKASKFDLSLVTSQTFTYQKYWTDVNYAKQFSKNHVLTVDELAANWHEATVPKHWALHNLLVPAKLYDLDKIWTLKGDKLKFPKEFIDRYLIPACKSRGIVQTVR